jgi:hypothetical protein
VGRTFKSEYLDETSKIIVPRLEARFLTKDHQLYIRRKLTFALLSQVE